MSTSTSNEILPEDFESSSEADDGSDIYDDDDDDEPKSPPPSKKTKTKQTKKTCPERQTILKDLSNLKGQGQKSGGKRSNGENPWSENDQIGQMIPCSLNL